MKIEIPFLTPGLPTVKTFKKTQAAAASTFHHHSSILSNSPSSLSIPMIATTSTLKIVISSKTQIIKAPQIPLSSRFPSQIRYSYSKFLYPKLSPDKSGFKCQDSVSNDVGYEITEYPIGRKKLAVFVSGGGSNFRAIHEAIIGGLVHGDVVVLVTDKPSCGGAEYARINNIPVILFPKTKSSSRGVSHIDLVTTLRGYKVDFILLAGYLKLIPVELVQAYPRSILNIHPSLLPAFGGKGFYGPRVHKAVIASGARYSGPTVHFVDENFDTGRILAQRVVPVLSNDTAEQLASRVLNEEHQVYVDVVSALCEERIVWREDGVPLIRSRDNPNEYK